MQEKVTLISLQFQTFCLESFLSCYFVLMDTAGRKVNVRYNSSFMVQFLHRLNHFNAGNLDVLH